MLQEAIHDEYVRQTQLAGIAPLELRLCQVNDCSSRYPVAYRTTTVVNSLVMGQLEYRDYSFATDVSLTGIRLAQWNVAEAMRIINDFVAAGRNIQWISVQCPTALATNTDMFEWMDALIKQNEFKHPEKLCLEFPVSLLYEDLAKARLSILDLKLLKVKTMLTDCASDQCPMSRLLKVPVDIVLMTPEMTAFTGSRDKPKVVPTLVEHLKSMRLEVVADGVQDDEQIRALARLECLGYIPADDYSGRGSFGSKSMSASEAILQKEEEELE